MSRFAWVLVAVLVASCASGWRIGNVPAFELHRQWMSEPAQAETLAVRTAEVLAGAAAVSPARLLAGTGALLGVPEQEGRLPTPRATPPLLAGCPAPTWPDGPFQRALGGVLQAITAAEQARRGALAGLPPELDAAELVAQVAGRRAAAAPQLDYRAALGRADLALLLAGMQSLVDAVQELDTVLAAGHQVPELDWRCETPLGLIVIDTTRRDNRHVLANPLLVVDLGGNDQYLFARRDAHNRISVLLDRGGNDSYRATTAGADPSVGLLGYGVLWDAGGNDTYEGGDLAQGAALFGMALLHDTQGDDRYHARGFAQAFAMAGLAVLHDAAGNDSYRAATHAQASAGPRGVALLLDGAGDERYALVNDPLVLPSSQLPDRNASMGQGAGRGLALPDGVAQVEGGLGLLLDLQGNDSYTGQVFAQGVGYLGGSGLLFDGGGSDTFEAAWYSLGAAAHQAVGVLVKRGGGHDRYRSTHATALAAAHDGSVAVFADADGNDSYVLGEFGLGGESEGGRAVFRDGGGADTYEVRGPCAGESVTVARTASSRTGLPAPCRR